MTLALYPGSFDPVTYGHIDIVTRAATLFEKLFVGVYETPAKTLLFTTEERVALMRQAVGHLANVEVVSYAGLTIDFAQRLGAKALVRGLRMSADFEGEFSMAMMNKKLAPGLDTVCLMSSLEYQFLSSSLLKEVARLGGDLTCFVPEHVALALRKKLGVPLSVRR